jgi:hypothetical protein
MTTESSPAARGRLSRLSIGTGLVAVAAAALLAACSSGGSTGGTSQGGAASGTTLSTARCPASSVTGKLGTVKRADGGTQLTVNGHPLYTFKQDSGPGSDTGNNFSDSFDGQPFTWHALTAAGAAAPTGAGSDSNTPTSNPYGY